MANHNPPRLFLIDGYALIYRAFYAMIARPLRTTKGENTSAAWGVVNFLLRLREKYFPDYVAWINDAGSSFREERYPEYKSTREKLDDELRSDFDRGMERITALLDVFRVPLVTVPGYEADDVIGTLATRAANDGLQAVIVSGDKDFYQLIGPGVALLNPGRGGMASVEESWVDQSNASERLGVPPGQVVDYLSLVGDSSDNIPGVKGIGEKGAQKLLAEFGDLDTILARAGEVTAKRSREALLAQSDNARLSRELVTIRRDVPIELDLRGLTLREPDREGAIRLLTELEFYSLAKKLGGSEVEGPVIKRPAAKGAFASAAAAPSHDLPELRLTARPTRTRSRPQSGWPSTSSPRRSRSRSSTILSGCPAWSSGCAERHWWHSPPRPTASSRGMRTWSGCRSPQPRPRCGISPSGTAPPRRSALSAKRSIHPSR